MNTTYKAGIRRKLKSLTMEKMAATFPGTCRYFGISSGTYYKWKRGYETNGESALINSKPCAQNPKLRIAAHIEEKILYPKELLSKAASDILVLKKVS